MKAIPESHKDLFEDQTRAFAYLATIKSNGTPQVTPIWFNVNGEDLLINSATGRLKDKNMRRFPAVALCISDPKNPYRYIQIQGRVVEITNEGAEEHIDLLNLKYHGNPNYPVHNPQQPRVTYKIKIEKVDAHG